MTQLLLDYYSGNRQPNFAVFEKVGFKAAIPSLDVEQYWASWWDKSLRLAPQRILDNAIFLWDYIKARSDLPLMVYTARWFTNGYCPSGLRSEEHTSEL